MFFRNDWLTQRDPGQRIRGLFFRHWSNMNTKRVIVREAVLLELRSSTKESAIGELIAALQASGQVSDPEASLRAVLEREKKMSTGLQNGIAIPHGKTEGVESLIAAVGIKKDGLEFDSLDGQPARVIVLTLSPSNRAVLHIQFLAGISKALGDAATRQRILDATTPDQVIDALCTEPSGASAA